MNPIFFGSSAAPCYGVYHPPRTREARARGVVLCPPFGVEHMRAHRAFRQLSTLLAKAGFPVLRFDFRGTGDSAGGEESFSLAGWQADVGAAVEELRSNAGVERVTLVGLRLGAALAALAHSARPEVDALVLWDPVTDGPTYVAELMELADPPVPGSTAGTLGVRGFPLPARLREELAGLQLARSLAGTGARAVAVVSSERPEVRAAVESGAATGRYLCVPGPGNWAEIDQFGSALLPQDIIQEIVACVQQEEAA